MVKHPAKFTDTFIPIFAELLKESPSVLDPFAGIGKIGQIKNHGYFGHITCCEIEKEWAEACLADHLVDVVHIGDSSYMDWAKDSSFSAICTSPTYGNRIADHFNARDDSRRITYKTYLGRDLNPRNSGRMNWGMKYRELHRDVYVECSRVLERYGKFILNISDHIRGGEAIPVSAWHRETLESIGFFFEAEIQVGTPRHRHGENHKARVSHEKIMVFRLYK